MRRVLQPTHTPRPLHEYATRKSWPHISQRARVQTRAPECLTPNISAGHALHMPAPGLPPKMRLHPAHPRAAAPATFPHKTAPLDTPHSALAAGVDTPQPAALGKCQLRVSRACQWPRSQSRPKLKLQQQRAVVYHNAWPNFHGSAPLGYRRIYSHTHCAAARLQICLKTSITCNNYIWFSVSQE